MANCYCLCLCATFCCLLGVSMVAEGQTQLNQNSLVLDKALPTEQTITASAWKQMLDYLDELNATVMAQQQKIQNLEVQVQTNSCSASDLVLLHDCFEVKTNCGLSYQPGEHTIFLGGVSVSLVYCDEDGRTLVASTVRHNSPIRAQDPRTVDLGTPSPDEDYMMAMSKWVALFGDGTAYDLHADVAATNKAPFRFQYWNWGVRAGDFAYKHVGGSCNTPMDSTTSSCSSTTRPQWVHNDNANGAWSGTFGAPCCSGHYGWGGNCGYGQFHGDYAGGLVFSFDPSDGAYRNPPTVFCSKLSFWAVRRTSD